MALTIYAMNGFTVVEPTPEEAEHAGHFDRVQCETCNKRMWASPIGLRSHRKVCALPTDYVRCSHCRKMLPVINGQIVHEEESA